MPVGDPPLRLRDLARIPVARLRGVGEKKGAALASAEITTTVIMLVPSPFCSQPGGPPGMVNSIPSESARVMQGLLLMLANMQAPGRY